MVLVNYHFISIIKQLLKHYLFLIKMMLIYSTTLKNFDSKPFAYLYGCTYATIYIRITMKRRVVSEEVFCNSDES